MTEKKAEHATIYAALAAAQMQMGKALKDSSNPAFRSKYADLASVVSACLPALNGSGICVYQPTVEDEGTRYVETILAHVSGEILKCRVPLIVQKNDMQGYGSAVTYARRYGLMCMAGIAPEDDDGNAAVEAAPKKTAMIDQPTRGPSAVDVACESMGNADSLDMLKAIWDGLPKSVQGETRVKQAANAAKRALTPPADDLGGDAIPY